MINVYSRDIKRILLDFFDNFNNILFLYFYVHFKHNIHFEFYYNVLKLIIRPFLLLTFTS